MNKNTKKMEKKNVFNKYLTNWAFWYSFFVKKFDCKEKKIPRENNISHFILNLNIVVKLQKKITIMLFLAFLTITLF